MHIKPSSAIRNGYADISKLAHDDQEPIYITNNGEGDLVVMSLEAYELREETLKLKAILAAGERSRVAGNTISMDESRRRLESIYEADEN